MSEETLQSLEQGFLCRHLGKYDEALEYLSAFDTDDQKLASMGIAPGDKSIIYFNIGECHKAKHNYYEAIDYYLKSESFLRGIISSFSEHTLPLYDGLILSYVKTAQPDKAAIWCKKRLNHSIRNFQRISQEVADSYYYRYLIDIMRNDPASALADLEKFFAIEKELDKSYASTKSFMETKLVYAQLAKQQNLIEKSLGAISDIEECYMRIESEPLILLSSQSLKMNIQMDLSPEEVPNQIDVMTSIIDNLEEKDLEADQVAVAYNNIAVYYMQESPEEALSFFTTLRDHLIERGRKDSPLYPTILHNIGMLSPPGAEAAGYFREAYKCMYGMKIADVPAFLLTGSYLISNLQEAGQTEEIPDIIREINAYLRRNINDSFVSLSEKDRSLYWENIRPWYTIVLPQTARMLDEPEVWGALYDGLLQSRSILLSSSISLKTLVEESDDDTLKVLYAQCSDLNSMGDGGGLSEELESRLLAEAKKHGSFMDTFSATHEDVRRKLGKDEIAIEFLRLADEYTYDASYLALVQTAADEYPVMVDICKESELRNWTLSSLYTTVWKKLEPNLRGVRRAYFSPDGDLFSLPVEYALLEDGTGIDDKIDLRRVSSTREVCGTHVSGGKEVALFGGMKFDMSVEELKHDGTKYRDVTEELVRARGPREAIDRIEPLPGTKREVEFILETLSTVTGTENVAIFKEELATEAAFKSYSGKRPRILHVASHGFYNSESATALSQEDTDNAGDFERETMRHSGLLFSGADNVRMGESVPARVEDGVLDAYEITTLDFHGTDLVTLSACQTGLGTVSGDGVFGLQRGFKKAGVGSILMSLWKVDDDATCALMSEFYKNFFAAKGQPDKHEALRKARSYVRSQPQWAQPKYWAGFILLD
ncbi:MAG: CHAT domain-containing protein [Muribaculum sp.]|nr:CHAT domain-containing protein [Muribaculum sp.]